MIGDRSTSPDGSQPGRTRYLKGCKFIRESEWTVDNIAKNRRSSQISNPWFTPATRHVSGGGPTLDLIQAGSFFARESREKTRIKEALATNGHEYTQIEDLPPRRSMAGKPASKPRRRTSRIHKRTARTLLEKYWKSFMTFPLSLPELLQCPTL